MSVVERRDAIRFLAASRMPTLYSRVPYLVAALVAAVVLLPRPSWSATDGLARAELVSVQSTHGFVLGLEACFAFDCTGVASWAGAGLGGLTAGAGASWLIARREISAGTVRAITSGVVWGGIAGAGTALSFVESPSDRAAHMMGAQLLGLGVGALVGATLKPTQGEVAFFNSAGAWGAVLALLGASALEWRPADSSTLPAAGGALVGLVSGAVLARRLEPSTGRLYVATVGGILGLLIGFGADLLLQRTNLTNEWFWGAGFGGAVAGLSLGWVLAGPFGEDEL